MGEYEREGVVIFIAGRADSTGESTDQGLRDVFYDNTATYPLLDKLLYGTAGRLQFAMNVGAASPTDIKCEWIANGRLFS